MTNQILIKELEKEVGKYINLFYQKVKAKGKSQICIQDIKEEISNHLNYLNQEIVYFIRTEKGLIEGPTLETISIVSKLIKEEKNKASKLLICLKNSYH